MTDIYELGKVEPVGRVEYPQSSDEMQEQAVRSLEDAGISRKDAVRRVAFTSGPMPVGSTGSPFSSGGSIIPFDVWPGEYPRFCKHCESELGGSDKKCPNCGAPARKP